MNLHCAVSTLLLLLVTSCCVLAQIKWTAIPQDQAVVNKSDVRLDCLAQGERGITLTYTWRFNGSSIQNKTSQFANHSLLIPLFTTSDEGNYECIVSSVSSVNSSLQYTESKTAVVIIAFIDRFLLNPKSVREVINTTVTFECITGYSAPLPEVYWNLNGQRFLDGVQLSAVYGGDTGLARRVSMKLVLKMENKYKGIIRCIAVNTVLEKHVSSSDASIFLTKTVTHPVILIPPQREVIVPVNSSLVLNCLVEGYKTWTLWYKNDLIIDGTSTSYIHGNGSMIFVRVLQEDSGIYYCQGKNSVGTVTSNTSNLTVTVIDVDFRVEPSDATIFAGQSLTLNCIPPISVPPAKVTWYKDNQPLILDPNDKSKTLVAPGDGVWDLHFTSVQAGDEGNYVCVAENLLAVPSSRTSRVATVTVQGAPIFIEPPLSQRVIKGRLLQLICGVQGSPTPAVTWLYDGARLQLSNQISFRNGNQELWITNIDKSHEGTYTCMAENIFGRKTVSSSVKVIVPPVTLKHFETVVVTSSHTAVLPCDVYGDPKPSVTWFKESEAIQEDGRRYTVNLSLHIENVTSEDRGLYACRAENEAGSTWANGSLSVLVPPKIIEGPSNTVVVIGQTALFPCGTEGVPKPNIQWLYNATRYLPEGVSFLSDRITLRITNVDWLHVGTYTCVASNSVGLDSQIGTLKLKVPPFIYNISGKSVVDKGETIQIDCEHKGTPAPTVEWIHKGETIKQTLDGRITFPSRTMLRIKFSTKSDAGEYVCKITNDVGTDRKSVKIYVIEPPKPPILTGVIPLSKSSVELTWIPNSQEPQTNVTGYAVNYKKRPERVFSTFQGRLPPTFVHYEVENLLPGTEYTFTISSENSAGLGLPSNALSVITLETGPSEPIHLRLVSKHARRVSLSWEVPQQQNGNIRKYQVQYREKEMASSIITEYDVEDILNPSLPSQEYELLNLRPNTQYEIRVRAANIQQEINLWGPFSVTLNVTTLIAAPSTGPRNITATALSPHIIKVQWQAPDPQEQNGPLSWYHVRYQEQYQSEYQEVQVVSSVPEVSLTKLSPWKNYSLVIEAENPAGRSPPSSPVVVQTLPAAPVTPPVNVEVTAQSSTLLSVSWEIPPVKEWRSEVSGSIVQYSEEGQTGWDNITVTGTLHQVNISNLSPWTRYRMRVAVFTDQVSPGLGPFSNVEEVRTSQDFPEPVRNLHVTASDTTISVYWSAPVALNGELTHYTVSYYAMGNTAGDGSNTLMQGISTSQKGPVKSLLTNSANTTIVSLVPATVYNVSVTAATGAGEGPPEFTVISTIVLNEEVTKPPPPPPPITEVTTDATVNTTSNLLTDPGGSSNRNLPVIVAGALTAGIFLLVIIIIIIWRCLKKRQAGRDHYMKSVVSGVRIIKRNSGNYDRQILDPANIGEDDTATYNNNNDDDNNIVQQRYGSFNSHEPVPQSPTSVDSSIIGAAPPSPNTSKKSGSFLRNIRNSFSGGQRPVFAISPGASGIENPSYFDEHMSATLPRSGVPSMTADEVYSQAEKSQRKNRMRSESAAAIAIMRSSGNLAIATDDTDTLINNEAFVVYNERTAL